MSKVQLDTNILASEVRCETAGLEPSPEICKILEDIDTAVFWNKAVVRCHHDGVGAVDEGYEVCGEPGAIETITCNLCMLVLI